jgi:hypothetical protein
MTDLQCREEIICLRADNGYEHLLNLTYRVLSHSRVRYAPCFGYRILFQTSIESVFRTVMSL